MICVFEHLLLYLLLQNSFKIPVAQFSLVFHWLQEDKFMRFLLGNQNSGVENRYLSIEVIHFQKDILDKLQIHMIMFQCWVFFDDLEYWLTIYPFIFTSPASFNAYGAGVQGFAAPTHLVNVCLIRNFILFPDYAMWMPLRFCHNL